ncbi:hypothetical protein PFDG_05375, partial [Plasmodium falciparum Dd2]
KYKDLKDFVNYVEAIDNQLKIKKKNLWMLNSKEDLMNELNIHLKSDEQNNSENNKKVGVEKKKKKNCLILYKSISQNNKDM